MRFRNMQTEMNIMNNLAPTQIGLIGSLPENSLTSRESLTQINRFVLAVLSCTQALGYWNVNNARRWQQEQLLRRANKTFKRRLPADAATPAHDVKQNERPRSVFYYLLPTSCRCREILTSIFNRYLPRVAQQKPMPNQEDDVSGTGKGNRWCHFTNITSGSETRCKILNSQQA